MEGTEETPSVKRYVPHEDYDVETIDNDIALLRLRTPLHKSDDIDYACIPSNVDMILLFYQWPL